MFGTGDNWHTFAQNSRQKVTTYDDTFAPFSPMTVSYNARNNTRPNSQDYVFRTFLILRWYNANDSVQGTVKLLPTYYRIRARSRRRSPAEATTAERSTQKARGGAPSVEREERPFRECHRAPDVTRDANRAWTVGHRLVRDLLEARVGEPAADRRGEIGRPPMARPYQGRTGWQNIGSARTVRPTSASLTFPKTPQVTPGRRGSRRRRSTWLRRPRRRSQAVSARGLPRGGALSRPIPDRARPADQRRRVVPASQQAEQIASLPGTDADHVSAIAVPRLAPFGSTSGRSRAADEAACHRRNRCASRSSPLRTATARVMAGASVARDREARRSAATGPRPPRSAPRGPAPSARCCAPGRCRRPCRRRPGG